MSKTPTKEDLLTEGDRRMQETVWRSKRKTLNRPSVLDKGNRVDFNFNALEPDEALEMADAIVKRFGKTAGKRSGTCLKD